MPITGLQLKAARELIGLSQLSLSAQFQLALRSVIEFEGGRESLSWQTLHHLERALEATGLEFTNGSPGVKLQRSAWSLPPPNWRRRAGFSAGLNPS
jgi:transcriptional regulator with XRE-family HTH domain